MSLPERSAFQNDEKKDSLEKLSENMGDAIESMLPDSEQYDERYRLYAGSLWLLCLLGLFVFYTYDLYRDQIENSYLTVLESGESPSEVSID